MFRLRSIMLFPRIPGPDQPARDILPRCRIAAAVPVPVPVRDRPQLGLGNQTIRISQSAHLTAWTARRNISQSFLPNLGKKPNRRTRPTWLPRSKPSMRRFAQTSTPITFARPVCSTRSVPRKPQRPLCRLYSSSSRSILLH